jgi:hypothetical protein
LRERPQCCARQSLLRSPRGRPALLITLLIPSQGAARTEGRELVYYRELRGRAARLLAPKRLRRGGAVTVASP